ncbi:MAG: hypothetical protein D3910_19940 [Candidatus Electrothrix sp. ATG2]|nr:hypothetical protein [Candidatus Electrothrix sp. ATG2]
MDFRINRKDEFIEIQGLLVKQYDDLIKKSRDASQIKNIIECLYHTSLLIDKENKVATEEIIRIMQGYLSRYFIIEEYAGSELMVREQIGRLENALQQDNELKDMLNISRLMDCLKRHKEAIV